MGASLFNLTGIVYPGKTCDAVETGNDPAGPDRQRTGQIHFRG